MRAVSMVFRAGLPILIVWVLGASIILLFMSIPAEAPGWIAFVLWVTIMVGLVLILVKWTRVLVRRF